MNESIYVTEVYNKIAEHFDRTRGYTWKWVDNFIKNLPDKTNVLDIGCGTGRNMSYQHVNCTGIDTCDEFIKICLAKNLNVIKADMCDMPFNNNYYDYIMSIASFHHLSTIIRREECLKEMYRVLKPNGIILFSVWSIKQPKKTRRQFDKYGDTIVNWVKYNETYERYYYIFQIDELIKLFNNNKLTVIKHFWDCGNEVFVLQKKQF